MLGEKKALGVQIKELRENANMTQGALAKAAGVSTAEICRIETGERKNPSMQLLVAILKVKELKVTNKQFLEITGFED